MELKPQKLFFIFSIFLINEVTAQPDCQQTKGENSQFVYSKTCSDGNVLLINSAFYSKSSNQLSCTDSGSCSYGYVSTELKLAYSINMSFAKVLYVPRIDGNCSGNFVSLAVSTNCIANAQIYDLASTFDDRNAYGNHFIFTRYNVYSNNNIPAFNKATLTIPAGCQFIARILETYAMTNKANVCAYKLVMESPPGNRIKSLCLSSSFNSDYQDMSTSQETDVNFYLERQYPADEYLIDLKIWIMMEIRQNGYYVYGMRMKSDLLATTTSTTTSSTTTTTTSTTTSPTTTTTRTSPTTTTTTSTTTTTTTTLPTTSTTTIRTTGTATTIPTTSTTTTTTTTSPTTTTSATLKPPSSSTTTTTTNIPQTNSSSTTTTDPIPFKVESGLSTEAKVGLGIGLSILCLLILLTIIGLIMLCLRSRRSIVGGKLRTHTPKDVAQEMEEGDHDTTSENGSAPMTPPPPPPLIYSDVDKSKYRPIRIKGSQKMDLNGIFDRDPASIYQPIGDVYSTVSKAGSVKDWQAPPEEDYGPGTVGKVNSYHSDTWELTHYSPPSVERGDDNWDQEEPVDSPTNNGPVRSGRNRFRKNQHTNSVIESHSKQKVKKAKHVTISHDPPSYMESQMDRPHNFTGGPNFMF